MIRLQDSQITQILPDYLSRETHVQALSYALGQAVKRLIDYCENTAVFATIDSASGDVLDLLALELDTQYYDDSMPIAQKRELIKNTMVWYMRAGTPAAVEELISTVFGKGKVEEWFQYGGQPYMFRVMTSADSSLEAITQFEKLIQKIKNIRSHIESVFFYRSQETVLHIAVANIIGISIRTGWEDYRDGSL